MTLARTSRPPRTANDLQARITQPPGNLLNTGTVLDTPLTPEV
jgi:hypothetical protein